MFWPTISSLRSPLCLSSAILWKKYDSKFDGCLSCWFLLMDHVFLPLKKSCQFLLMDDLIYPVSSHHIHVHSLVCSFSLFNLDIFSLPLSVMRKSHAEFFVDEQFHHCVLFHAYTPNICWSNELRNPVFILLASYRMLILDGDCAGYAAVRASRVCLPHETFRV